MKALLWSLVVLAALMAACGQRDASTTTSAPTPPPAKPALPTEHAVVPGTDDEVDPAERERLFEVYHEQRCRLAGQREAERTKAPEMEAAAFATAWDSRARKDPHWAASVVRRSLERGCGEANPEAKGREASDAP
ncbi:MAG: hypothetical protein H6747_13150 [Deltaproteobacteria bacterium]|nr:hypothetical protein [Deltaproteobacteria bacterium]